uniref:topless-related protein 2-like n=1 Tax=Fragaria vesca subsp. vesca TaxID=101020 RepID=UPI0005CA5FC5|nr:PREDICTED: topless-related protein 2-like [Fragaria vesca subsp. vesca]
MAFGEKRSADDTHRSTIGLTIRYLDGSNLGAAARSLERHSGLFFNYKYFEDCFVGGDLEEAEAYLSGFTSIDDNDNSTILFFDIRWHKFLQALDLKQRQRARRILREELNDHFLHLIKDYAAKILAAANFRDELKGLKDLGEARLKLMEEVRTNIEANPSLKGKIVHPSTPFPALPPPPAPAGPSTTEAARSSTPFPALYLVPVNLQPEIPATSAEAPRRNRGRPRGRGRRNNSRVDPRAAPSATRR